jgi:D-threonate/D-erythronate kinase
MSDYFLADDLSGALDAAAAFHHVGRRVKIALSPEDWPQAHSDEVVAITTETRNASPAAAASVVRAVVAEGNARGAQLLYKKIDSTLRGPVAAEVAALATALPDRAILFCPANPRVGRTVRDGILLVHGVPVAQTEFAHDPASPVRESSIREMLRESGMRNVIIADAQTEEDLTAAVTRMTALRRPWIAIGSGALARPVAALHSRQRIYPIVRNARPPRGPVLFVCGSVNRVNRDQAARLVKERGVPLLEVNPRELEPAVRAAVETIRASGAVALMMEATRTESRLALNAIVSIANAVMFETKVTRVFATGGETAFALCRTLKIPSLRFHDEIESGLILSIATGTSGAIWWAVKPGGFGDELTWVRGFDALQTADA